MTRYTIWFFSIILLVIISSPNVTSKAPNSLNINQATPGDVSIDFSITSIDVDHGYPLSFTMEIINDTTNSRFQERVLNSEIRFSASITNGDTTTNTSLGNFAVKEIEENYFNASTEISFINTPPGEGWFVVEILRFNVYEAIPLKVNQVDFTSPIITIDGTNNSIVGKDEILNINIKDDYWIQEVNIWKNNELYGNWFLNSRDDPINDGYVSLNATTFLSYNVKFSISSRSTDTFKITASDLAKHQVQAELIVTIDDDAPGVIIQFPIVEDSTNPPSYKEGEDIVVKWDVSADDDYSYFVIDIDAEQFTTTNDTQYTFTSLKARFIPYNIQIYAVDRFGNRGIPTQVTVQVLSKDGKTVGLADDSGPSPLSWVGYFIVAYIIARIAWRKYKKSRG